LRTLTDGDISYMENKMVSLNPVFGYNTSPDSCV